MSDIIVSLHLNDLWKEKYVNSNGYTWCDANNIPKSRIDYIFISTSLLIKIKQIIISRIPGTHNNGTRMSDHRAIKFNLSVYDNERGKGYWKLNTSLLKSNEYKHQVNKIITDISKVEGSSIDKWESLKISIKDFSRAFSIKRQTTYKQLVFQIEREISEIENSTHIAVDMNRKQQS